jgi:hypothetical protein
MGRQKKRREREFSVGKYSGARSRDVEWSGIV